MVTYLTVGHHEEGSSSTGLHNHSEELGVDSAEGGVPGGLGDPDVVIALLPFGVGAKNMPKLRLTNHTKRHFESGGFLGPEKVLIISLKSQYGC